MDASSKWAITIRFMNDSSTSRLFESALEARLYARNNVSYTGGRVAKVYMTAPRETHSETLWQHDWNDASKAAGLSIPS
jgi:hypothetical protein